MFDRFSKETKRKIKDLNFYNRVEDFPPGYFEPDCFVEPPEYLLVELLKSEEYFNELKNELTSWKTRMDIRKKEAWDEYNKGNKK